jgi:hypothetical protein
VCWVMLLCYCSLTAYPSRTAFLSLLAVCSPFVCLSGCLEWCADQSEAVFALAGAAAVAGGVTHSLSASVVVCELTGAVTMLPVRHSAPSFLFLGWYSVPLVIPLHTLSGFHLANDPCRVC